VGDRAIIPASGVEGFQSSAVVFDKGRVIELNSLLLPDSGWHLSHAAAINDNDQVVGYGVKDFTVKGFILQLPKQRPLGDIEAPVGVINNSDVTSPRWNSCIGAALLSLECQELDLDGDLSVSSADRSLLSNWIVSKIRGDINGSGGVDQLDGNLFGNCLTGASGRIAAPAAGLNCQMADMDGDGDVDNIDYRIFGQKFGLLALRHGNMDRDSANIVSTSSYANPGAPSDLEAFVQCFSGAGRPVYTSFCPAHNSSCSNPTNSYCLLADLNGDYQVDHRDFALFGTPILRGETGSVLHNSMLGDLNADCRIDGDDTILFLYAKESPKEFYSRAPFSSRRAADMNQDGVFDSQDSSLLFNRMLFYDDSESPCAGNS